MNTLYTIFTLLEAVKRNEKREKGFTLLEYCAGAAVLAAAVFGAMTLFGNSLNTYFQSLADWITGTAGGSIGGGG